jgi:predicted metal-dependent enzyme (double-stranded beta helix superfamily)
VFDMDAFVAECQVAVAESEPRLAIRDVLDRALADPTDVAAALKPGDGGITVVHRAPDLTVLNVVWAPHMRLFAHDHRMWAAIGIYGGQEDNAFFRRSGDDRRGLTESGGKELTVGDVLVMGDDTIHSVANQLEQFTAAIHVYGGDLIGEERSQWGPGPVEERPYDKDEVDRQFEAANRAWASSRDRGGREV